MFQLKIPTQVGFWWLALGLSTPLDKPGPKPYLSLQSLIKRFISLRNSIGYLAKGGIEHRRDWQRERVSAERAPQSSPYDSLKARRIR